MERWKPRLAIASIIGSVALYDATCESEGTITDETRRLARTRLGRYVVPFVVITTALHLLDAIPPEYDWIHRLAELSPKG